MGELAREGMVRARRKIVHASVAIGGGPEVHEQSVTLRCREETGKRKKAREARGGMCVSGEWRWGVLVVITAERVTDAVVRVAATRALFHHDFKTKLLNECAEVVPVKGRTVCS